MTEKNTREILAKLDEIEKQQAKLRAMVARLKSDETGSGAGVDRRSSKSKKKRRSVASKEEGRNCGGCRGAEAEKNHRASMYLKKLRNNSSNFVAEQWRDKKEKMKNFLGSLIEEDVVVVSRGSQTSDTMVRTPMPDAQQMGNEYSECPRKESRHSKNRASVQAALQQLLEHFNHSRDSQMEGRVSVHDQPISNREPRRVRKESSPVPDDEPYRILSNPRLVSVADNGNDSHFRSQLRQFVRKYSNSRSQSRSASVVS